MQSVDGYGVLTLSVNLSLMPAQHSPEFLQWENALDSYYAKGWWRDKYYQGPSYIVEFAHLP